MLLWLSLTAFGGTVAYTGATIHPVASDPIENGILLVTDGKIDDIGTDVAVPDDAQRVDLSGKVVIPGLVDTHSHIANTGDLNERSGPLQPQISAIDALDPTLPSVQRAQAGGLTTVNVMPGSGNLVGGQTAYLKLRDANTIDAMLLCGDRRTEVCGGMKMANGTNPRNGRGGYPSTRMASAASVRDLFLGAQKYRAGLAPASDGKKKKKKGGDKPSGVPLKKRDFGKDALLQVMDGDRIVHFHTHRADDIVTAVKLSEEFEFEVVLHHVSEAWKVADFIAEHAVPVSLIIVDSPGGKEEAAEIRAENAAVLEQLEGLISLHTDDPITDSRLFLRAGAMAIRAGMTEEGALAALTLSGARQLGLDRRVGSLEVGKDADFVVLNGPPFSVWTQVEQTWIDGEKVFDRSDPTDRLYATGGHEVADRVPQLKEVK